MEVLNRNQRSSALWRLSGLYAATIVIMGIIVFQAWKAYQAQVNARLAEQDAKEVQFAQQLKRIQALSNTSVQIQAEAEAAQQQRRAADSLLNSQRRTNSATSVTGSMQSGLNDVNSSANQAKATQTTIKNIGAIAKDVNPLKK